MTEEKKIKIDPELEQDFKKLIDCFTKISSATTSIDKSSSVLMEDSKKLNDIIQQSDDTLKSCDEKVDDLNNIASNQKNTSKITLDLAGNSEKDVQKMLARLDEVKVVFDVLQKSLKPLTEVPELAHKLIEISKLFKLIAFNTEIEAARLGPAGESIAAITNEINRLTDQSHDLSNVISSTVKDSMTGFGDSGQKFSSLTRTITHLAKNLSNGFGNIHVKSKDISSSSENSFDQCHQIKIYNKELLQELNSLTTISDNNIKVVSESKTTSLSLKDNVESLDTLITNIIGNVSGNKVINLNPKEAYRRVNEFVLVDVRRTAEYTDELGHIEGTTLETITPDFEKKIEDWDRNKTYLFICRSGGRSSRASRIALSMGFTKIYNMSGGMLKWDEEELPAVGKTKKSA